MPEKTRILFVCLGNICRSPTAHAVVDAWISRRKLGDLIEVDSCGTGDWHIGHAPDARATDAAAQRGYDLAPLRARQIERKDFDRFDLILAMDNANLLDIRAMSPASYAGEIDLFLRYTGIELPLEVPDPYYGGEDGFAEVLQLVERATAQLLDKLAGPGTGEDF
ncbi:MAG: low molecular weight phosphotyrosine protein phosphatase [Gammaproteobacteria bacterium]|nr:low molecular weight phosphotyrosine protein phosphatase [Gammaproteobacteria bacterium]NNM12360.1 low molecular weight phosphotyrosine protein phosphatase [Pseudomonadales bacterium]